MRKINKNTEYKYYYNCSVCRREYGSDKPESGILFCPLHDKKIKEKQIAEHILLKNNNIPSI